MANYNICIGVSEYDNIGSLKFAHKDAEDLHSLFTNKFQFKKSKLFSTNCQNDGDKPTYGNIINYLYESFPRKTTKKPLTLADNFWFFFSGHGREFEGKHYLLPSNVSRWDEALERTALAVEDISFRLREYSGAGNIIMLIDACRESGRKSLNTPFYTQRGIITIASCEPKGYSDEIDELQNGSFTYALRQSLQSLTEDNCATVERLMNSLSKQVAKFNLIYKKGEQNPYAKLEPHSKYNLFLLPDYIKPTLSDIAQLEKDAWKAVAKRDLDEAETMWRSLVKLNPDEAINALIEINRIRQELRNTNTTPVNEPHSETQPQPTDKKSPVIENSNMIPPTPLKKGGKETNSPQKEKNFTEVITTGGGLFGLFGEKKEIKLEMVAIPAGEFMMGSNESDREKPIHRVKLREFYIGKYPITQAQYQAIMGKNPSRFAGKNNPVEGVSWNDAQEFCQKLSAKTGKQYKLPSEAQWEYACRAGSTGKWCFGDDENQLKDYAWYDDNSNSQTHPVGRKKPNQWGLYDMHGNVWEYCEDDWHKNYQNAPNDGKSWIDDRRKYVVLRGGSWSDFPNDCRSASRYFYDARDYVLDYYGFRVVCVSGRTL